VRVLPHFAKTDFGAITPTVSAYLAATALAMTVFPPPHPVPSSDAPTESRIRRCWATAFSWYGKSLNAEGMCNV
jgi:hypothetical protein